MTLALMKDYSHMIIDDVKVSWGKGSNILCLLGHVVKLDAR